MADQTEPRADRYFNDQPQNAGNQNGPSWPIGQNGGQAQQFFPPAESFGSFGPLPDYQTGAPFNGQAFSPVPFPPVGVAAPVPGNAYPPIPLTANAYSPGFAPGNSFAPAMPLYPPYGMYPPFPVPVKTKKPLLFPLTREAPALLQIFGMLLYSLLLALSVMGCLLTLFRAFMLNGNMYANPDGSANGLSILVTIVLLLLLVPAGSLLSGAFFGSWRGLLVSILSLGGGFLLTHVSDPRFGNPDATLLNYLPFFAPALAALVVGFVYDRRKYAAWWKSMFTMFLGTAVLIIWLLVVISLADASAGSLDILAANAHMTLQNYMAYMAIGFGCLALLAIPLLGLLYAGLEGIIHAILARLSQTR